MSKDEALKMALEALEKCDAALAEELAAWDLDPPLHRVLEASTACAPAITAIKEALKHVPETNFGNTAEQPPARHRHISYVCPQCYWSLEKQPAQQQEPFGYFRAEPFGWTDCAETDDGAVALYESPQQKPWVGLTEQERNDLEDYCEMVVGKAAFDAIETKLKEKNT